MKVKLFPQGDGTTNVFVKRTLMSEGPSRSVQNVPDDKIGETVDRLCAEMRQEQAQRDA